MQRSHLSGQLSNKEKHMYEYAMREIRNGLHDQDPARMPASLHGVRPHDMATNLMHDAACVSFVWQVIDWIASKTAETIISKREAMISAIECAGRQSKESGRCAEWSRSADAQTTAVLGGTNGFLFHTLLAASEYKDAKCVELLRTGIVISFVIVLTPLWFFCVGKS